MSRLAGRHPFDIPVYSTTAQFVVLGRELLTLGVSTVDFALTIERRTGDALALPGVEFVASNPAAPDSPLTATTGSYSGTSGTTTHASYDASASTAKWSLKNGLWVKLDTGATPGVIQGSLSVAVDGESVQVGERSIEVSPNEDTNHPSLYILGGFLPRLGATNFRGVINGTEIADMAWRFYARLANDPRSPQPMEALGAGFTDFSPSSGIANVNTGNLSVTGLTGFSRHSWRRGRPYHPRPTQSDCALRPASLVWYCMSICIFVTTRDLIPKLRALAPT